MEKIFIVVFLCFVMAKELVSETLEMIVDPDHGDLYGHLTNDRYGEYIECSRIALQEKIGCPVRELKDEGFGIFIREYNIVFKQQVYLGEKISILSRFLPYEGGPRVGIKYKIRSPRGLLTTASQALAFVNLKDQTLLYRPPERLIESMYEKE